MTRQLRRLVGHGDEGELGGLSRDMGIAGHTVTRQIKYEWDYLYRSLDVMVGQARFSQIPALNREWNRRYLEDLAGTEPDAVHVVIRDQAGFHPRDGDTRLPERIRITEYLMTSNQTFESERLD